MPLGDSITYGKVSPYDSQGGGYRTSLWGKFVADGLKVDFVGSQFNGFNSLGDKDHEGHPGAKINTIARSINEWLSTSNPEIILLMVGTNDTRRDSAREMVKELSTLVDQITQQSPDVQLLVASIPPIHPDEQSAERIQRVVDFNQAIPGMVRFKVAQGKKVDFVDMRGLIVDDLTSSLSPDLDNGLHPNTQGYGKIANFWHDAVLNTSGDKDTLSSIENIIGTAFKDELVGDAGANILEGGVGRDILTGGANGDTFVYRAPTEGRDTITDFSVNDRFSISASGFGGSLVAGINLSTTDSPTGVFCSRALVL